jgi:spermidine synthase
MKPKVFSGAALVFGSGFCALLYQTTWLREFRLIFGSSTAASAAVIGIFMGGLGLGSALLGKRAEKAARPLAFYAQLEFFIAISAALTPTLVSLVRMAYIASGGTFAMGNFMGTCVRLLLAAIVLAGPTLLMGGTLPAMARFAVSDADASRRGLALLYGMNTLGAVAGAVAGTFFLLERFGNHTTLYLACILNAGIAGLAWWSASGTEPLPEEAAEAHIVERSTDAAAPFALVLGAAAVTGFAFLLMELVWYRMLSPILGGTAFTFGLILAVALLGIGSGGVFYSLFATARRPTLNGFACTCALEALLLAIPFALGDRIALSAMLLKPLAALGFYGRVAGWAGICGVIVFPAAFIAGIQFPMLLGLLGKGRKEIGLQTGAAYAWNTGGAIAGSLVGGFGFIPLFSATGTWKIDIALLVACAFVAAIAGQRHSPKPWWALPSVLINTVAIFILIFATGPTVAWRHGQLDRMKKYTATPNQMRDLLHSLRRDILWQADGIESSIGISKTNSLAFIVNGKCDGNATNDAGTQVMSGLLAALTHPNPKRAAVVGLGTGSTAGWIAALPSIEQVDVMELEPVIARFAAQCATVNHDALHNPKLNLIFGDGRELLQTTKKKYDLIVSEPSNPYRAGVASLFTREYYETLACKLNRGGLFAQWMQAYDVDLRTVRIFYASFGSVFPYIETWQTHNGDLLLIGSKDPINYDAEVMRARIAAEPFRTALPNVWRTMDLEGVFSHYLGNGRFARTVIQSTDVPLNTDDRMLLEFAFARNRQSDTGLSFNQLRRDAAAAAADRPEVRGALDWNLVQDQRIAMSVEYEGPVRPQGQMSNEHARLLRIFDSYVSGDFTGTWEHWKTLAREPRNITELALVAECLAERGDETAPAYIEQLQKILPTEAEALRARFFWRQNRTVEAKRAMQNFLQALHSDPWPNPSLVARTLDIAIAIINGERDAEEAQAIFHGFDQPFAVYNAEGTRESALLRASMALDHGQAGKNILRYVVALEPNIPWDFGFLRLRSGCYTNLQDPRAGDAQSDLLDFLTAESGGLGSAHFPAAAKLGHLADAAK